MNFAADGSWRSVDFDASSRGVHPVRTWFKLLANICYQSYCVGVVKSTVYLKNVLHICLNRMCLCMVLDRTIHSAQLAFVPMQNQCAYPYMERDYGTPLMKTLPLVETYKHLKSATS